MNAPEEQPQTGGTAPIPDPDTSGVHDSGAPIGDLLQDLDSPDDSTRVTAIRELGEIANPTTIPALLKALYDPVIDIRNLAVTALTNIGTPEALAAIRAWKADHKGGMPRRHRSRYA